jgi:hypothetical protein
MGIRFHCPNGHKLNVKSFLAGQKGICPVCGVAMEIPLTSTRPSSHEDETQPLGGAAVAASDGPPSAVVVQTTPSVPTPSVTPSVPTAIPVATAYVPSPAPPSPPPPPGAAGDVLSEGGNVVWYVRPPSGGQFGPATSDVMRAWLTEGRVTGDSLIWREGWRDWLEAVSVFPQLAPRGAVPGLDAIVSEAIATETPVSHPVVYHGRKRNTQLTTIIALVVAVVVLFAIFLAVVVYQK